MNPFIRLYETPIHALTTLAYTLLLLATTIALAGLTYRLALKLYFEVENRRDSGNYAPSWQYVPPYRVIALASGVVFLAAVEAFLIAGIFYVV